jgi:Ni,Fe-hydrogenase III large subunit
VVQLVVPVEGLGLRKLLAASKLPREEFERFKRTGQIRLASGAELGLREISAMKVGEFEAEIEALRPKRGDTDGQAEVREHQKEVKAILRGIEQSLRQMEEGQREQYEGELRRIAAEIGVGIEEKAA